jgi:murein L,D-transpeptidase YcbB/YkuD
VAAHDLLLTDSFVTLATHSLRGKVDPLTIHPTWTARQRAGDVLEILRAGLAEDRIGEALASTTPGDPGYTRLTEALARYRALEESRLPDVGDAPWDSTPERLSALRRHLDVRGDLEGDDLDAAIRRFQRRHGLAANGEIDPPTLEALRIPIAERVEKLRVNLERWRWLPEDLGERQVRVNIAGFDLRYVEGDEVRLRMRAIVGKSYRKTPVFSDTIRYLVLNPTWTVPSTIFREDLLPEVRRDSRTLERRGLEVLSRDGRPMDPTAIEWRRVRHGDLYFRQPPGPNNAPRQDLFEEPERAFSSGCIRLERPLELAALLTRPPGAPRLSSTVQSS